MTPRSIFPFSAVVGQDDVKMALLLNALDRRIGGVLLRGDKGSAKSTLARGLAALLPGESRFVELPVSATEDRVVGTLDMEAALTSGQRRFHPGLLFDAHEGVLYVDEINLLPDHLVDVLLDVAASGVNRVERESISESHPSRFVLIGSMNPEEGDLRPQLLDRFGLAVDVVASHDPIERVDAVQRRLAFDDDPLAFGAVWSGADQELAARIASTTLGEVPTDLLHRISELCVAVGSEGLRADLVICRAAGALAGWEGRRTATVEDVRRVAHLALAHRRRRSPFDDPGIEQSQIDDAFDNQPHHNETEDEPSQPSDGSSGEGRRDSVPPDAPTRIVTLDGPRGASNTTSSGRRTMMESSRGRVIGDRAPRGPVNDVAIGASVRAAATRLASSPHSSTTTTTTESDRPEGAPLVTRGDVREAVREEKVGNLLILAVDASASMGAEQRMEAVKGAVLSLLLDAYQRRDRVAVVTFGGEDAEVVLRPTGSLEIARARLSALSTGGRTPLAAGIESALGVAKTAPASHAPLLIFISDGRATAAAAGNDPLQSAMTAAAKVRQLAIPAWVLDVEDGPSRLGLAVSLAEAMGARHIALPELSAHALTTVVREELRR